MNQTSANKKLNIFIYPLTLTVGALMVAVLLGYVFGVQKEFSDVENRYLQLRPAVSWQGISDGSFMESFDKYTDEQIPLRSMLVKVKTCVDTFVGKIENHGIAKGSDGYLFDKSTDSLAQFDQNLAIIDKFIKNCDRKVYVGFAPTSTWMNEDRLPKGMPVLDEKKMHENSDLIFSVNPNAEFINLYSVLEKHYGEELYYRTDHHWKSQGAYYGYEEIAKALDAEPVVDINNLSRNDADNFFGTFYAKYQALGVEGDSIEYYDVPVVSYATDKDTFDSIYDDSKLEIYDKYAMFMHGNYGRATVQCAGRTGKKLLIFKDSYANALIPFLCFNYDTIEIVDLRYMGGSVQELLEEQKNADVLMLYNYSFLNDDNHFYKLLK